MKMWASETTGGRQSERDGASNVNDDATNLPFYLYFSRFFSLPASLSAKPFFFFAKHVKCVESL